MQHNKSETPAPFVELEAGEYLLEMLFEARPTRNSEFGPRPLGWSDVAAYLTAYPVEVEHYERALILKMSEAFVTGMNEGKSPFSIPPDERDAPT